MCLAGKAREEERGAELLSGIPVVSGCRTLVSNISAPMYVMVA
jgi:hypothetical protein